MSGGGKSQIFLDKEGRWFHEGVEITHRRTVELFNRSLVADDEGFFFLVAGRERAPVEVEDTPFLVKSIERVGEGGCVLVLSDKSEEPLDPSTLVVSGENVLYCLVKKGRMRARFTRPAYYRFLEDLGEDEEGFYVKLGGRRWPLPMEKER